MDPERCTILLVDDEPANLDLLELMLRTRGYGTGQGAGAGRLVRVADARTAMAAFEAARPDLVLLDLHMPHRSGFDVLADLATRVPADEFLPVLVLTADATAPARERALAGGAHDFVTKPFDRTEVLLRVRNLLHTRALHLAQREAVAMRDRVLAVVAHDLRNPLAAVRFDVEMLRARPSAPLAAEDAQALARVERAATRMDGLIEDLLDAARLNRGPLALDRRAQDVGALLLEAAATLDPLVDGHGLRFEVEGPETLPAACVDGRRLLQAVSNLVGNAVKFAAAGGCVSLTWAAVAASAGGREVHVTVRDDGPGIPADRLPHIFDAFWQARPADRRGLGLGLAIARAVAEAHGGRLWVESTPGAGAAFHLALPLEPAPADAPPG